MRRRRARRMRPDSNSVTLGLAFQPASNGTITGVRFYKEADNTGTHTGQPVEFDRDAAGDRHVHQ